MKFTAPKRCLARSLLPAALSRILIDTEINVRQRRLFSSDGRKTRRPSIGRYSGNSEWAKEGVIFLDATEAKPDRQGGEEKKPNHCLANALGNQLLIKRRAHSNEQGTAGWFSTACSFQSFSLKKEKKRQLHLLLTGVAFMALIQMVKTKLLKQV